MVLVSGLAAAAGPVSLSQGPAQPGPQERTAIARARALESLRGRLPWRDFDPTEFPAIVVARGEWALAFGFEEPPEGFAPLPGLTVWGRPVARDAGGSFVPPLVSPARLGDRWVAISEVEPPDPAPSGSHLGSASSEKAIARMLSDAFALHLMRKRGAATPHVPSPVGYPDSAELIALSDLQRRIHLEVFSIRSLTEVTIPDYRRLSRQAVAVHHERARLIGEELAAAERQVERWDGLRADATIVLHKLAMQGAFRPEGLYEADPGFTRGALSGLNRALVLTYPQSFAGDAPETTVAQIAARTAAQGFITERLDGAWRVRALEQDRPIADLLSAALGEPQEGEETEAETLLGMAKESFGYDMLLENARAVRERLAAAREAYLAALNGPKVVIRLNGVKVNEYLEDASSARHLGGGSLLHERGLRIRAEGLALDFESGEEESPAVITRSSHSADRIDEIALVSRGREGGLPAPEGGTGGAPLSLRGNGLAVRITGGRVSRGAGGETIVDLGPPRGETR